ncbi:hypothetical protein RCL1_001808 [Eukaryota sp. TZLM3-RCL]
MTLTTAHGRVFNFSAGPSMLPLEVLEEAHSQWFSFNGTGMGVFEMSHRSKTYDKVIVDAVADLREVMNVPDNYSILFLQGGASQMFSTIPLNLLRGKDSADYLVTGEWSKKAVAEAKKYCNVNVVLDTKDSKYTTIPSQSEWKAFNPNAAYVHYCWNETIHGVEFDFIPEVPEGVPLVCDMSSNFLSRPVDVSKFGMIYGGAQKNFSIAGSTFVIVRNDLLGQCHPLTPGMMDLAAQAKNNSMVNTPCTYSIYIGGLVLKWVKKFGGLEAMLQHNERKAKVLYDAVEEMSEYYACPVDKQFRSLMNIPFVIKGGNADLDKKFVKEAEARGLTTLAGHRSMGGFRASIYNAMPVEGIEALVAFMREFAVANPVQ